MFRLSDLPSKVDLSIKYYLFLLSTFEEKSCGFFLLVCDDSVHDGCFGFLNSNLVFGHAKASDFRILFQEPTFDFGITEGFALALGDDALFLESFEIRHPRLFRPMGQDVALHVLVGQTCVGIFVAVGANVALDNSVVGIVAANGLKVGVISM